jgi:hypothetical protein
MIIVCLAQCTSRAAFYQLPWKESYQQHIFVAGGSHYQALYGAVT